MLEFVEIELFSYCNRKCSWCPNKFIDRTHNINMEDEILDKILAALKDIRYDGYISLSRYNEPMSKFGILYSGIQKIKAALPECKIVFNTNGDFPKHLQTLLNLGIDITVEKYNNFWGDNHKITNRGGSLNIKADIRNRPCHYPEKFMGIDYNGNAMPCCDLRSDNPLHEKYIIGNIKDDNIINLYNKQQELFNYGFEFPCQNCQRELGRYICE